MFGHVISVLPISLLSCLPNASHSFALSSLLSCQSLFSVSPFAIFVSCVCSSRALPLSFFPSLSLTYCLSLSLPDLSDNLDDFTFHEQLLTPRLATDGAGANSSGPSQGWSYLVAVVSLPLPLLLLGLH